MERKLNSAKLRGSKGCRTGPVIVSSAMVTVPQNNQTPKPRGLLHGLFGLVVILKGLNGLAEIVCGIALFLLRAGTILAWVDWLTRAELIQNPNDALAFSLHRWAVGFSHDAQVFAGLYLLVHGVVKVFLASLLLTEKKIWAFPLALALFSSLVAFAIYRLSLHWSWALAAFVALDLLTIWLIAREWRALNRLEESS
ncbi:MAG TPA: DUF2127 domain-containing protein [Aestuariivirga sp.]|nr:DUF2127 domain-containing protein [Aestuariivirga sp.]